MRVYPSGLSVSRAFGDFFAKYEEDKNLKEVITSEPDFYKYKLDNKRIDFILIGCDGMFDVMSNQELVKLIWRYK